MPESYEYIDDPEKRLASHRRDTARQKEIDAQLAEMTADQFAASVEVYPGNAASGRAAAQEATRQRDIATSMHELAGTSPEDFAGDVLAQIEGRLRPLEENHLLAVERAEHPEVYDVPAEQADWDRTVAENGLRLLRKRRDALASALEQALAEQPKPEVKK